MTSFFHAYDLRGTYPDQIDEEVAEKVGKAYGTYVDGKVLVGRDGRTHGEKITEAFIEGVKSTGTDVVNAGAVPSPVIYYGSVELDVASSAVVTASHNPSEYTGFKFTKENALAMSREGGMKQIQEIYESESFDKGDGSEKTVDLEKDYIEFVAEKTKLETDLEVAVNYGNGITAGIGGKMLEAIGCKVTEVNSEIDGDFPNHLPAPGEKEAQKQLKEAMSDEELGIIFDGDGDRAGFIYEGDYITEDEVLALFSENILEKGKGKVVHDLRASKLVKERITESGGEPLETRVGHTFISEEIHEDPEIVFAGELSGHYYFPALDAPWDDGLLAAALMCRMVSEDELEKLGAYPDYPVSPELRIDCPERSKQKVVSSITESYTGYETSTVDGVKIYFESGWALVRPSNTEPKMSVRCEADTEQDLENILSEVRENVEESIEEFS
ncbi:phosphomannomutase/phosphoglucomutase [Candidatus Nanohalococcus occultus]|uniref:Phosphomannomutase n=1 Tax=Candidatus Nanohalococcus occultus TaxID=2978047 RepID=A0ABY8CD66_9ARCH|nr:Phosphomannomutase [Candidatus Nanohaloarchaeota archaeon SVXNc]